MSSLSFSFLRHIGGVVGATWSLPLRFLQSRGRAWRRQALSRSFSVAQLALGQRMYAQGIDDGFLGAQIALLDKKIWHTEAVVESTGPIESERERLIRLLADRALEEDAPLPGADDEYVAAREAQARLNRHNEALAETWQR